MALAAAAAWLPSTPQAGQRRLTPVLRHRPAGPLARIQVRPLALNGVCTIAGLATGVLLPFPLGVVAAPGAFYIARRLLARMPAPPPVPVSADVLATCADLVAACLDAGALPSAALRASGACLPAPLGPLITAAGETLADGAAVEQALPETGVLAPLSAIFRRSSHTGSAMTEQLVAMAEQLRADDQFDRLERAHRVGVLSALPLGLCMLPAFLLLAVVPAVAGLGSGLLH